MNNIFFIIIIVFFSSCNKDKYIRKYVLPKTVSVKNIENNTIEISANLIFKWVVPKHWILGEKNSMRIGSYKIPYDTGIADLSISNLPGDGGGLSSNVNRWRNQINLPPLSLKEINDIAEYGNSMIGPYKMFKIVNELNLSDAYLCFMISNKEGTVFIKLIASQDGINVLENDIKNFISTFQYN